MTRSLALLVALVAAAPRPAPAQQSDPVPAAAMDTIRARYGEVQRNLREGRYDSTVTPYESLGGEGSITAHRGGGRLHALAVRFDGDGASWRAEFTYWDDGLLFGFRRWERFPPEGPSRASEDRWYVWDGRVLRWLRTDEDGARRVVAPTDPDFSPGTSAFLASAACWRRYAETRAGSPSAC